MRTSLLETQQIDAYLMRRSNPGDALVFEANLLLHPSLKEKLRWQQESYQYIKNYGRDQLKMEIEAVHQQLFTQLQHKSFSQKIRQLFSKS